MNKVLRIILVVLGILILVGVISGTLWMFFGPKTQNAGTFPSSVFNFFGGNDGPLSGFIKKDTSSGGEGTGDTTMNAGGTQTLSLLRQVYQYPVSSALITTIERTIPADPQTPGSKPRTEHIPAVRIMERSTGNIYDIPLDTMVPIRITNTTFPKAQEALWNADGSTVLARAVSDTGISVESTVLRIKKGSVDVTGTPENESIGSLETGFSKSDLAQAVTSPDKSRIFSITGTLSGSKGEWFSFTDGTMHQLVTSPLKEWLVEWPEKSTIYLTTKPSSGIPGYLYAVNADKGGTMRKVLGGIPGLTTLMSPTVDTGLIGSASGTTVKLSFLSKDSLRDESLVTFPEKCVWDKNGGVYCGVPASLPPGAYPDIWYQGRVLFDDSIWYLNTATDTSTLIASPADYNAPSLDIINPTLSADGKYLLFMNKHDMTPWIFEINR